MNVNCKNLQVSIKQKVYDKKYVKKCSYDYWRNSIFDKKCIKKRVFDWKCNLLLIRSALIM